MQPLKVGPWPWNCVTVKPRVTPGAWYKNTLKIAEQLHFEAQDILHIRRGALLHDIGKMGIPDHILLKPGPLTADEWVIMRQHPTLAAEMLTQIKFLKPAIDIPLYHHEKWGRLGVSVWIARRGDSPIGSGLCHLRCMGCFMLQPSLSRSLDKGKSFSVYP